MNENQSGATDALLINEIQLILAEKRTSLSVMRTGIAVFAIPLSVLSVLIATSKYYDVLHVLPLIVPLMALNLLLVVLGAYLVTRAFIRLHRYDAMIRNLKEQHSKIAQLLD